ncbi:uncharacterized protein N7484_003622 [Penicillium longicatenatum]|uniref:uncharacterized protein n=1 Tax=Penicillium longicatenatum TaxID=1561947 RepID=UPI002548AFF7|nr:uncharacterized protein N7484_003622 [Penicillium longicatenatum]KAJ5649899.1 hypothetical protein N7484_003622 [Penicillium longicatenatum]
MLGQLFSPLVTPLDCRRPMPAWFLPSFLATGTVTCFIPTKSRWVRLAVGAPIFVGLLLHAPSFTTGEVALDFVTGVFMTGAVIKWLDFAVFHDPGKSFWRVPSIRPRVRSNKRDLEAQTPIKTKTQAIGEHVNGDAKVLSASAAAPLFLVKVKEGEHPSVPVMVTKDTVTLPDEPTGPSANGSLLERLQWSVSLWCSTRGIGWNWKVSNVPEPVEPGYSRVKFLRHTLHRFLLAYLGLDFVHSCTRWYTLSKGGSMPNIFSEGPLVRTALGWFGALETYNALQLPFYLFATITTAVGLCRPEQWPNLMGSFSNDMWSVRQFWGKCWHGHLRRAVVEPSRIVVDFLRLPKGSNVRKYAQLYISFFISALTHHAGAYLVGRNTGGMYSLWLGQATVIMFEDVVIYYGKKHGIKSSPVLKALGKLWVCLWFCLPTNFPTGAGVVINQGMGLDPAPLNFSTAAEFPASPWAMTNLFNFVADRATVFWMLSKAINLLEASSPRDVLEAAAGALGAAVWKYSRSV